MSYVALYRKFRPQQFSDVKGQEHIVTALTNQIKSKHIGHAYLFNGTRGTGKTTVAKIFARAVNCEHTMEDESPDNSCDICKRMLSGTSMNVIEIDAASNNSVQNVRDIIDQVTYPPTEGKYKVYIIDEAHMLSNSAFNALLKTLEEPPAYVIFILATTEVYSIPITILSRCQRYDFHRISVETISNRIRELMGIEKVDIEDKAINYIAKTADGSMRDSLSILDECISFFQSQKITYENVLNILGVVDERIYTSLFNFIREERTKDAICIIDEVVKNGQDLTQFVKDFIWYLRNLILIKNMTNARDIIDVSNETYEALKKEALTTENEVILRYIRIMTALSNEIKYVSDKRVVIEIAIIKLIKPEMESDNSALVNRIENLEKMVEKGKLVVRDKGVISPEISDTDSKKVVEVDEESVQKIPLATPEEVKKVSLNWNKITASMQVCYKAAIEFIRKVTVSKNGKLLLIFDKDGIAAYDLLNEEDFKKEIEEKFIDFTGKKVEYEMKIDEGDIDRKYQNPIDVFSKNIGIEIETEE